MAPLFSMPHRLRLTAVLLILFSVFGLATSTRADTLQPCPTATLASYLNLPGGGCVIGSVTFAGLVLGSGDPTLIVLTPIFGTAPGFSIGGFDGNNPSGSLGWIDIQSFAPFSGGSSTVQSGGTGAGRVDLRDVTVTKTLDKSSPVLFQGCTAAEPQFTSPLCGGLPSSGTWLFPTTAQTVGLGLFFDLVPDASGAFGSGGVSFTLQTVPEPGTVLLVGASLVTLVLAGKRALLRW